MSIFGKRQSLLFGTFAPGRHHDKNADALQVVIEHYRGVMFEEALRLCQSEVQAEDVVQDVLLKFMERPEKLHTFIVAPSDEKELKRNISWLRTVVRNQIFNDMKKKNRHQHIDLDDPELGVELVDPAALPDEVLQEKEIFDMLEFYFGKYKNANNEALRLRLVEQLDNRHIAMLLDISADAVEKRCQRAKVKMRDWLRRQGVDVNGATELRSALGAPKENENAGDQGKGVI